MLLPDRSFPLTHMTNDNAAEPARLPDTDPHGQAALFLVESLLHALVAKRALTTREAIEVVVNAAEVSEEIAKDVGETSASLARSLDLLQAIESSMMRDIGTSGEI